MAITAAMVKELREVSGAGMMDCKKALTATEGDMDKAMEFLREKGLATAQKKAGRIAAEGIVMLNVSEDGKKAVAVEVNAETDFVAKNEKFRGYVAQVAEQAMDTTAADVEGFLAEPWKFDTNETVGEELAHQIATIGENMNIRRFQQVKEENGFVASYTHMGGKIGVLVDVETDVVNDDLKEMAKNVAMQVAAISPKYTSRDEVSKDDNWRVQEVLAKAFDEFCKNTGYEKALPIIDEWLENDNPNTRRAVTEGLRIWTSRPYFKDNPNEAIRRIVALKEDPSEYVRKSVGNALRDISKKFPELIKDELNNWKLESKEINQVYKLASKLIN